MAEVAMTAPTSPASSITGVVQLATESQSLTGYTGISFPNNGAVLIHVIVGASGAGSVTIPFQYTVESQTIGPDTVG